MYGTSVEHVNVQLGCKVAKTILNLLLAGGKLGKVANLTFELNLLAL
jgi:hypothetical protein